jgi:hypothetical protein
MTGNFRRACFVCLAMAARRWSNMDLFTHLLVALLLISASAQEADHKDAGLSEAAGPSEVAGPSEDTTGPSEATAKSIDSVKAPSRSNSRIINLYNIFRKVQLLGFVWIKIRCCYFSKSTNITFTSSSKKIVSEVF